MDFPDCETAGYRPPVIHASASGFSIFLLCFTSVNKADDDVEVALCLNYNRMSVRNFASPCSQSAVPNHTHSNTGAVTVSLAQPSNPPAQQLKTKQKKIRFRCQVVVFLSPPIRNPNSHSDCIGFCLHCVDKYIYIYTHTHAGMETAVGKGPTDPSLHTRNKMAADVTSGC